MKNGVVTYFKLYRENIHCHCHSYQRNHLKNYVIIFILPRDSAMPVNVATSWKKTAISQRSVFFQLMSLDEVVLGNRAWQRVNATAAL